MKYKDAGVDVDEGNSFVEKITPLVKSTYNSNVLSDLGGFSGIYDLSFIKKYNNPVLVSSTDGVGTKLELARELGKFDTIGIDLVAMVVNDIVVQGASPHFFLDYYATGRLEKEQALQIMIGIISGCREAGCALLGGETAEMPGVYEAGKFDLAGFGVGVSERDELLPRVYDIEPHDIIVGIPSFGFHSNGYSLIRRITQVSNDRELLEKLLIPTRIYVNECMLAKHLVKAFVHITGGGFVDNIPRVLPSNLEAHYSEWKLPEIFQIVQEMGNIDHTEMMRTFNCGFGMVAILKVDNVDEFRKLIPGSEIIGETVEKK